MKKNFDRRAFLAALGLGTGAAMLPSLGWGGTTLGAPSRAKAQETTPKRFVLFYTGHGTIRTNWKMNGPGLPADQDAEFSLTDLAEDQFSPILQPLYRHRQKLLVVEGLAQTSALADEGGNNHWVAQSHILTGAPYRREDVARPSSKSIDQIISDAIGVENTLAFPSLELGTSGRSIITRDGGTVLPTSRSPEDVFTRLFPTGMAMGAEPSVDDLVRAQRGSVLDLAAREYERIAPQLSGEDRRRLEQHRDLIRDLESRITSLASVRCEAPNLISSDQDFDQFAQLTTAAFSCDRTRVVSIQMRQLHTAEFGAPEGRDVHQDYAHRGTDGADVPSDESSAQRAERLDAVHWMTEYNQHHSRQFSRLLDMLDAVPEGDGTLLDNTCVIWLTELANGPHDLHDIPVVMAGACGGAFQTGRYRRYAQNRLLPEHPNWWNLDNIGAPHSQLLVSLGRAMGADIDAMPMTSHSTNEGTTIDLTGPLPGLTG